MPRFLRDERIASAARRTSAPAGLTGALRAVAAAFSPGVGLAPPHRDAVEGSGCSTWTYCWRNSSSRARNGITVRWRASPTPGLNAAATARKGSGEPAGADVRRAAEAILFVAEEPVASSELALVLELPAAEVETLMEELGRSVRRAGARLRPAAGRRGYRLASHPAAAPFLERFVSEHRPAR